jgi:cysteinyl-tRNA synthetase
LNIFDFKQAQYDLEIQELLRKREKARQEKKWKLADELRQKLLDQGVMVRDSAIVSSTFK